MREQLQRFHVYSCSYLIIHRFFVTIDPLEKNCFLSLFSLHLDHNVFFVGFLSGAVDINAVNINTLIVSGLTLLQRIRGQCVIDGRGMNQQLCSHRVMPYM